MQPQFDGLYVTQSKKILTFFGHGLNQRQRYIQCVEFAVQLQGLWKKMTFLQSGGLKPC